MRPFMPRDNDKNNDSRGRRDRPSGGKGRSGAARGPEKKFAKRGFGAKDFAEKRDGDRRPYAGKSDGPKFQGKKAYAGSGKPYAGKREGAPPRRDYNDAPRRFDKDAPRSRGERGEPRKDFRPRDDRGGEKRPYTPRGDARPASRFSDKKFDDKRPYAARDGGDKRPYSPRGEGFRKDGDRPQRDRPYGDRPQGERKFGGDKKFSRGAPDRGPRKDFGTDRGDSKT